MPSGLYTVIPESFPSTIEPVAKFPLGVPTIPIESPVTINAWRISGFEADSGFAPAISNGGKFNPDVTGREKSESFAWERICPPINADEDGVVATSWCFSKAIVFYPETFNGSESLRPFLCLRKPRTPWKRRENYLGRLLVLFCANLRSLIIDCVSIALHTQKDDQLSQSSFYPDYSIT